MKRESQIKVRADLTIFPKEREVLKVIFEETILKNKRCASLSHSDISKKAGIKKDTVRHQLKRLKKRKLITIDKTEKTNIICMNVEYKEIF